MLTVQPNLLVQSLHKLVVVDLSVLVQIRDPDHGVHVLVRHVLSDLAHGRLELRAADERVPILVEHLERLLQLLLLVGVRPALKW